MLATSCNDTRRRLAPGEIADLAARWRAAYPLFGGTLALRLLACAPWPPAGAAGGRAGRGRAADPGHRHGRPTRAARWTGSRRTAESLATARFLELAGRRAPAPTRAPRASPPSSTRCCSTAWSRSGHPLPAVSPTAVVSSSAAGGVHDHRSPAAGDVGQHRRQRPAAAPRRRPGRAAGRSRRRPRSRPCRCGWSGCRRRGGR